jgi:hypothetical protein
MRRSGPGTSSVAIALLLAGTLGAALPQGLGGTFQGIASMFGGDWAFGVIELSSGDTETMNAGTRFTMEIPHLPLAALGIEMSNSGEIPLDEMIARDTFFWERLHYAQQGGRGMCMALIWTMGDGRINDWIADNGFAGTEINGVWQDYPNCPNYDPNYISVDDALDYLGIVYSNFDNPSAMKIGSNPPFSDHIRETLGFGNAVYGWMDVSDDSKQLFVIVDKPAGSDLGIVILASGLDDRADVDRGFRMLYQALSD